MSKELETITSASAPSNGALNSLKQQAEAMGAAYQVAERLANTQMVPAVYRGKPDDATAAILYGAELGLQPLQALQQIFVVHGTPAIYARTMVALLKDKGFTFETVESTNTSVTVRGESPRGEVEQSTWTIDRAKQAGYTSNKKYQTDPQAMLYAKAAAEVCRKLAPNVLLGLPYTAEEIELEHRVKATARRIDQPTRGASGLRAALEKPADTPETTSDDATEGLSQAAFMGMGDIQRAESQEQLGEIMRDLEASLDDAEYQVLAEAGKARWEELAQ